MQVPRPVRQLPTENVLEIGTGISHRGKRADAPLSQGDSGRPIEFGQQPANHQFQSAGPPKSQTEPFAPIE